MISSTILAIIASVISALAGGYVAGRRHGRDKQQETNTRVQQTFNKIDRAAPDLDGSIDRLRKRAGNDGSNTD